MSDLSEVLRDVRASQRMVVAFNQRILPIVKTIGTQLGGDFYHWKPSRNAMPGRGSTDPFSRWHWDYSPMQNVEFMFLGNGAEPHDLTLDGFLLVMHLISDTAIEEAFKSSDKNWDALDITKSVEESRSVLRLYAFGSHTEGRVNDGWWSLYRDSPWPTLNSPCTQFEGGRGFGIEIDLSQLNSGEAVQRVVQRMKEELSTRGYVKPKV